MATSFHFRKFHIDTMQLFGRKCKNHDTCVCVRAFDKWKQCRHNIWSSRFFSSPFLLILMSLMSKKSNNITHTQLNISPFSITSWMPINSVDEFHDIYMWNCLTLKLMLWTVSVWWTRMSKFRCENILCNIWFA